MNAISTLTQLTEPKRNMASCRTNGQLFDALCLALSDNCDELQAFVCKESGEATESSAPDNSVEASKVELKFLAKRNVSNPAKMSVNERAALHYASCRSQLRPMSPWETMLHLSLFCSMAMRMSIEDFLIPKQKRDKDGKREDIVSVDLTFTDSQWARLKRAHQYMEDCFKRSVQNYICVPELTLQRFREHVSFTRLAFAYKSLRFKELFQKGSPSFEQIYEMTTKAYGDYETYQNCYKQIKLDWHSAKNKAAVKAAGSAARANKRRLRNKTEYEKKKAIRRGRTYSQKKNYNEENQHESTSERTRNTTKKDKGRTTCRRN